MQIGEDSHRTRFDDVAAKARKISRPGTAGVDAGGHPAGPAELFGVDAERRAAPVHMGVQVDQPRRDDATGNVQHLGCRTGGQMRPDPGDLAAREGDVRDGIEALRRIDDPSALEDKIDGHWVPATGCVDLLANAGACHAGS